MDVKLNRVSRQIAALILPRLEDSEGAAYCCTEGLVIGRAVPKSLEEFCGIMN